MVEFEIEDIAYEEDGDLRIIILPDLAEHEVYIVDPIVAPTSGLRIQIYDINEENGNTKYSLTNRKFFLFLRVFKAISQKYIEMSGGDNLKILIVTDERPSRNVLLDYCSQIFAHDGYEIFHQTDDPGESKLSSPYGAASVALLEDIDLVIVLTASHNELSWNGVKFYIDYPIPISGDIFKEISRKALGIKEIRLKRNYEITRIDAEQINNDYIIELLSKIIDIECLRNKKVIIWPYLGKARGIVNLFKQLGAQVVVIDEEINPPNPIKEIREEKLQKVMESEDSNLAILLDADRDRIALYVKQNGKYYFYIPNEIYSAMHNILAKEYNKKIINVRTIPSDLRGDDTSALNILTGVGYKHLGLILYFLFDIKVDQSKIDTAILYLEDENKNLIKFDNAELLKNRIARLMEKSRSTNEDFLIVMWEESGGHTLNLLNLSKDDKTGGFRFTSEFPLIADKYPVPALVLAAELICRGFNISDSIDWSIVGINQTTSAVDEEKVRIMENFQINDGKRISIGEHEYFIKALSDNNDKIDIYQLKRDGATLYFRPSGTGPDVRFYIFGDRETYQEELSQVINYVKENYI